MKVILSLFVIALPMVIYPIFLRVPIEISRVFGQVEIDAYSWYRMWLVVVTGITLLLTAWKESTKTVLFYWFLLIISTVFSQYYRTSLFGSPWEHEGYLVLIAYIGLYLAAKRLGPNPTLEYALDIAVIIAFLCALLQLYYGNVLNFPPIKFFMPQMDFRSDRWPLYGTLGCGNHLGLFASLFFPYALIKRKYLILVMVLFLAVSSGSRAALISIIAVTVLINYRAAIVIILLLGLLSLPFKKEVFPRVNKAFHELHYPIKDSDLSGRGYMWKLSVPLMRSARFYGYGPATFGLYFPQKEKRGDDVGFNNLIVDRPHNLYLNIWYSTGLLSLVVLIVGFGVILAKAKDRALKFSCISFLITGLTTDSVLCVTPYFIIFLGLLSHKRRRNEHDEKGRHAKGAGEIDYPDWVPNYWFLTAGSANLRRYWQSDISTESN